MPPPGTPEIVDKPQPASLGSGPCEQHTSLCLGGIQIEKTALEDLVGSAPDRWAAVRGGSGGWGRRRREGIPQVECWGPPRLSMWYDVGVCLKGRSSHRWRLSQSWDRNGQMQQKLPSLSLPQLRPLQSVEERCFQGLLCQYLATIRFQRTPREQ